MEGIRKEMEYIQYILTRLFHSVWSLVSLSSSLGTGPHAGGAYLMYTEVIRLRVAVWL